MVFLIMKVVYCLKIGKRSFGGIFQQVLKTVKIGKTMFTGCYYVISIKNGKQGFPFIFK